MRQVSPPRALSRRAFLKGAAGTAVLLLVGCRVDKETGEVIPNPAGSPTLTSAPPQPRTREIEITAITDFYEQQYQGVEHVDSGEWTLSIDGLVDNPVELTYDQVLARPRAEMMRTLECIGNPVGGNQIGNANWAGFWLAELLDEVGVRPEAVRARFAAADGYNTSVAREYIDRPGVLMAYEMNGQPLTPNHGFPLRIFMPGLYGQKMPKWITRIEFIDNDRHRGYWEQKGWSETAQVKTNSQIMVPSHISQVPLAEIEIYGVAYAGDREITGIEVGIEQGEALSWLPAEMLSGPSNEVWTQFYLAWTPEEATSYTLLVRATDAGGFTQEERAAGILQGAFPDGTDKIQNIVVKAGA